MDLTRRVSSPLAWLAAATLLVSAQAFADPPAWEQIFLNGPMQATLADGSTVTVDPSCSGGPIMTPAGPVPAPTQYSFFVQRGNPNKLLVAFDGGGACWDEATCIGSVLAGSPTYAPIVNETPASMAQGRGLLDSSNPANPFKEYTKVFVPYCTADVHWGSRDTTYVLPLPTGGALPWTMRHRGSQNTIAVVDWLRKNGKRFNVDLGRVHDLTVTGLSAGAYGTLNGFAFLAEEMPRARHNLVADAGIGVLTQSFFQRAMLNAAGNESWGVQANLPGWVPGFQTMLVAASGNPNILVPLAFQSLALWKPRAHFASITAELDSTQVFFYSVMKGNFSPGLTEAIEWYLGMKFVTLATAALPNYRYFIEDGTFHTFLGSDQYTYGVGGNGISVAEWMRNMVKPGNRTWDNLEAPPPF